MEAKITSHAPLSLRHVQTAEQITNQNMDFFPRKYLLLELRKHFIHSTYRKSFAFNINQHSYQLKVHNLEMKIKSNQIVERKEFSVAMFVSIDVNEQDNSKTY